MRELASTVRSALSRPTPRPRVLSVTSRCGSASSRSASVRTMASTSAAALSGRGSAQVGGCARSDDRPVSSASGWSSRVASVHWTKRCPSSLAGAPGRGPRPSAVGSGCRTGPVPWAHPIRAYGWAQLRDRPSPGTAPGEGRTCVSRLPAPDAALLSSRPSPARPGTRRPSRRARSRRAGTW